MNSFLGRALLTVLVCCFAPLNALAAAEGTGSQNVVRVELPQAEHRDPVWLTIVDRLAWPVVACIALIVLRKPLVTLLGKIATPGTEFAVGGLAVKLPIMETKLDEQQKQLNEQSAQIKRLVTLSMSWFAYDLLYQLNQARNAHGVYLFRTGATERNLRFLIDHGYLKELLSMPMDGQNLADLVEITEIGQDLISLRGPSR